MSISFAVFRRVLFGLKSQFYEDLHEQFAVFLKVSPIPLKWVVVLSWQKNSMVIPVDLSDMGCPTFGVTVTIVHSLVMTRHGSLEP